MFTPAYLNHIKTLYIASDHAGFEAKSALKLFLEPIPFELIDLGCHSLDSVDYPLYGQKMAEAIQSPHDFGILICGSGIGISIAANRYAHIRAALCHHSEYAKLARQHNDANVIAMGSRLVDLEAMKEMVRVFLSTPFEAGRHAKRVEQLSQLNEEQKDKE